MDTEPFSELIMFTEAYEIEDDIAPFNEEGHLFFCQPRHCAGHDAKCNEDVPVIRYTRIMLAKWFLSQNGYGAVQ